MPATKSRNVMRASALVFAMLVSCAVQAATVSGSGTLISAPFVPEIGDEVLVLVSNVGPEPARLSIDYLSDLPINRIDVDLPPNSSTTVTLPTDVFIPSDFPVLVVIRYQAPGLTLLRTALQVRAASGATRIFTDGFESGDVSF